MSVATAALGLRRHASAKTAARENGAAPRKPPADGSKPKRRPRAERPAQAEAGDAAAELSVSE